MRFKDIVEIEFQQDYYKQLHQFVENEYLHKTIFPPKENIFRALNLCDYENVKVVILGQDPYHELHQANGLAFSDYFHYLQKRNLIWLIFIKSYKMI